MIHDFNHLFFLESRSCNIFEGLGLPIIRAQKLDRKHFGVFFKTYFIVVDIFRAEKLLLDVPAFLPAVTSSLNFQIFFRELKTLLLPIITSSLTFQSEFRYFLEQKDSFFACDHPLVSRVI